MIDFDASELRRLCDDLGKIPARVVPEVAAVVKRGAHNIKTQMVAEAEAELAGGHAKRFPTSITYDMEYFTPGAISYVIGPDKDRTQGALGNILYFGTSNNAAVLDINTALDAETPKFLKALADVAAKATGL